VTIVRFWFHWRWTRTSVVHCVNKSQFSMVQQFLCQFCQPLHFFQFQHWFDETFHKLFLQLFLFDVATDLCRGVYCRWAFSIIMRKARLSFCKKPKFDTIFVRLRWYALPECAAPTEAEELLVNRCYKFTSEYNRWQFNTNERLASSSKDVSLPSFISSILSSMAQHPENCWKLTSLPGRCDHRRPHPMNWYRPIVRLLRSAQTEFQDKCLFHCGYNCYLVILRQVSFSEFDRIKMDPCLGAWRTKFSRSTEKPLPGHSMAAVGLHVRVLTIRLTSLLHLRHYHLSTLLLPCNPSIHINTVICITTKSSVFGKRTCGHARPCEF